MPNRGTTPHNHKTWAVVVGMEGHEQEVNWDRTDDGAKPGYADLKRGDERRAALYLRTSTANGQTTKNQRRELNTVAKREGWALVKVFEDAGISGAKGRDQRPELDAMMQAVVRREVDIVAAWSVDRLGRSLTDLLDVLKELHPKGVDLYLHQQGLDTSTPAGKAMFQMMGVFAEFERAMIRERVMAGLARAREEGTKLGRPPIEVTDAGKVAAIRKLRKAGNGVRRIASTLRVGVGTVRRVLDGASRRAA